ncbi:cupin domain-containing protein [Achromobacter sp. GG226]|uniref:cupin domain-containing protein n=1 Tax=Verticiella alkaliphila TaxID=2779529 RepID=UPI001C0AB3E8|nr:cupin domain-containing protein [Verticiella sp. GG226]MBU4611772.1 cupin domain-containing protein [Verticiella sp. GG226]
MLHETADITRRNESLDSVSWNILGQVYTPKQVSEDSISWHATFPEETFVPPHVHPLQDEYIYVLEGRIDLILDGKPQCAHAGDLVRMPRGIPHAFFNNSGLPAKALFWAAPAGKLLELYRRIHNVASPAEVVNIAREYDVVFLPPVSSAAAVASGLRDAESIDREGVAHHDR